MFINKIKEMGAYLELSWKKKGNDLSVFADIAHQAIEKYEPFLLWDSKEVIDFVAASPELVKQHDKGMGFGQPPLTLYWEKEQARFFIGLLFWKSARVAVHDHLFTGAFSVMEGQSVQNLYTFEGGKREADGRLEFGKLEKTKVEILGPGDACPIYSGRKFIHDVWHVVNPTVTLIIRSVGPKGADGVSKQFRYHRPGIALRLYPGTETIKKKEQLIKFLWDTDRSKMIDYVEKAFLQTPFNLLYLFRYVVPQYPKEDFLQSFNFTKIESDLQRFAELAEKLISEEKRYRTVNWAKLKTPDQCLLSACMMGSFSRDELLSIVRLARPNVDPLEWCGQTLQAIMDDGAFGMTFPLISGSIIEASLRAQSEKKTLETLQNKFGSKVSGMTLSDVAKLRDAMKQMAPIDVFFK